MSVTNWVVCLPLEKASSHYTTLNNTYTVIKGQTNRKRLYVTVFGLNTLSYASKWNTNEGQLPGPYVMAT